MSAIEGQTTSVVSAERTCSFNQIIHPSNPIIEIYQKHDKSGYRGFRYTEDHSIVDSFNLWSGLVGSKTYTSWVGDDVGIKNKDTSTTAKMLIKF